MFRSRRSLVPLLVVLATSAAACGGSGRARRPVFATSQTQDATQSFEELRDAWERRDQAPATLRAGLERHIKRFPNDGTLTTARLYLAFMLMQADDYYRADAQLALLESTPRSIHPGPEADMFVLAKAKSKRHAGDNASALKSLQSIAGKAVDETVRSIFLEELTLAALGAGDDYEAIGYMDAWLRGVSEDKRDASRRAISTALEGMPAKVVEDTYRGMRQAGGQSGYSADIQRLVASRLAKIAAQKEDAQLARWLLDVTPGGADALGDAGPQVLELAASRRGLREVQGRTVGLLLPIFSPEQRDAAASVLRGVSWALELPKSSAERRDSIRLVVRNDSSDPKSPSAEGTDAAMEELFGEGAAVVIAGIDPLSADRALSWGEKHGFPVMLLHPPAREPLPTQAGYVLGESRDAQVSVLARALVAQGEARAQLLTSSFGRGRTSLEGALAQGGLQKALETVDCGVQPSRQGVPRFPLEAWSKDKTRGFLVAGPRGCLSDLLDELKVLGTKQPSLQHPSVGFTLDAELPSNGAHARLFSASAGVLPIVAKTADDLGDPEVLAFYKEFGQVPSWWSALGRDAGILARQAVSALPVNTTSDPQAVAQRHAIVAVALGHARAPLWSTDATGFEGGHVLARTLRSVELK